MTVGNRRFAGQANAKRALRVGVSATCLALAGLALAPAIGQVNNLAGNTLIGAAARNALVGFDNITNGALNLTPLAGGLVYNGGFSDLLGVFSLTKSGTETLTLGGGGLSSHSGDTRLTAGLVLAADADVLSPFSVLRIDGGAFDTAGFDQTVGGLRGSGPFQNSGGAAVLTIDTGGVFSYNGDLSGDTAVIKTGAGSQSFGGTKTYTGGTRVLAGTLRYVSDAAFGSGDITFDGAAILNPGLTGTTVSNNIVVNADLSINMGGASSTLAGDISGGAANQITKNDFGDLTLTGDNSGFAGGFLLVRGQINLGNSNALGTGTFTTTTAQVTLSTVGDISLTLANNVVLNGILNFELPNAPNFITFDGTISDGSTGVGSLFLKTGNATVVVNGANSYSGFTRIATGVYGFGNDLAAGTSTITSGGNAGLAAYGGNRIIANEIRTDTNLEVDTRGFDMTLNGLVRDNGLSGGIEKLGAGTLTLTAANTYTGDTLVTTGTVIIDGSVTSNIIVGSGATLGGSGSVIDDPVYALAKTVTVNAGGILAPGTGGAGTLSVSNLTLDAGSIFNVDLQTPGAIGSGINDLVEVAGTLTLGGGTINVSALPGFTAGSYRVINFTSFAGDPNALLAGTAPPSYAFLIDVNQPLGQVNLLVFAGSGPVQYWDGSGPAGVGIDGGPGTWNAGNTNWTDAAGTAIAPWGGGTGIFQTVGGAVSVVGTQSYENLIFNVDGYVLSGGTLQADAGTLSVINGATTVINSVVDGINGLTKSGSGNLVLNAVNTYAGGTDIQAGTVTVGDNLALGAGDVILGNDATLANGAVFVTLLNDITTEGNGLVNASPIGLSLAGDIDGPGSISQVGTGILILAGDNSFINLGINQGTVALGTNTAAGDGGIAINDNATLAFTTDGLVIENDIVTTANGLVATGLPGFSSGFTITLNGDIGGPGSISNILNGELILNGNNSYTNLGINRGTVTVGTNTAAGIGGIAINDDATLKAGADDLVLTNDIVTTANGIVDAGPAGNTFTLEGDIGGPGSISQVGLGNLVLNGNNSYINLGINRGTVTVGSNTAAGNGGIAINDDATLAAGADNLMLTNDIVTTANGIVDAGPAGNIFTLAGDIGGPGSISQVGEGNLVLNGNNSFNNLGINRGTVTVGSNTAAGSGGIAINDNATLAAGMSGLTLTNGIVTTDAGFVDSGAGDFTLTGAIGGAGSLTKTGSGILTLLGENNFAGGLTVADGTLVGSVGSVGSGPITTNAALVLDQLVDGTIAADIDGTGTVTKTGAGTLTLAGNNSFAGGLTISDGTLVGASTGLGSGPIAIDAALVIDQAVDGSLAAAISGAGSLTKTGDAVLTLSGNSSFSGPTTVGGGTLNVTGTIAASPTTVQAGGSLTGTGTVGSLNVQEAGTVSPGTAPLQSGTLTVNGALTLASGSTLIIDAGSDLLQAAGPADIAGDLVVNPIGGTYRFGEQVIVSSSARTGEFATTTFTSSFGSAINASVGYTATSVFLELTPGSLVDTGGDALSPNSLQVAAAFDRAVDGGYDPNPFFPLYNQGNNLDNALSQLSGELHSAERRVLMDDTRVVRETAFDRLNAGFGAIAGNQQVSNDVAGGDFSFWLRGAGAWGNADADGTGSSFNTNQWGVLTGIDYGRDGFKVGAMFYYTSTDIDFIQLGNSTVETTGGALYGGYRGDTGWAIGMGGAYGSTNADGQRGVNVPGLQQTLQSSINGTSYQVFGELAYDIMDAPETRAEPFFRIAYVGVKSDAFTEVGGIAALEAAEQSNDMTLFTLGLRGSWESAGFRATASAGWQYATGDLAGDVTSTIAALDSLMLIKSTAVDENSAALEFEASYGLTDAIRLGLGYSGIIGANNANNALRATLSVAF